MTQHQRGENTHRSCRTVGCSTSARVLEYGQGSLLECFFREMGEIGHVFSLGVSESALQSKSPILSFCLPLCLSVRPR